MFTLGLYDKLDLFPFFIVGMPYLSSNATSKIFHASLGAKILRIGRTTTDFGKFKLSCATLISELSWKSNQQTMSNEQCLVKYTAETLMFL